MLQGTYIVHLGQEATGVCAWNETSPASAGVNVKLARLIGKPNKEVSNCGEIDTRLRGNSFSTVPSVQVTDKRLLWFNRGVKRVTVIDANKDG
jgi:hypothetical protein